MSLIIQSIFIFLSLLYLIDLNYESHNTVYYEEIYFFYSYDIHNCNTYHIFRYFLLFKFENPELVLFSPKMNFSGKCCKFFNFSKKIWFFGTKSDTKWAIFDKFTKWSWQSCSHTWQGRDKVGHKFQHQYSFFFKISLPSN